MEQRQQQVGDLPTKAKTLYLYVALAVQQRELEGHPQQHLCARLGLSHQAELLPVHDTSAKAALAREALSKGLTCLQLRRRVSEALAGGNPRAAARLRSRDLSRSLDRLTRDLSSIKPSSRALTELRQAKCLDDQLLAKARLLETMAHALVTDMEAT